MPELIITRDFDIADFDIVRGDGWTVYGRIVPLEQRQEVRDTPDTPPYLERFARDAFTRDVDKGGRWINLRVGHFGADNEAYLGRCQGLEARPHGLYGTFRIDREHPLAEAARSGELTRWSVGAKAFSSRRSVDPDGRIVTDRLICAINHVAATPSPQYAGAGVLLVREHQMADETSRAPIRDALISKLRAERAARG